MSEADEPGERNRLDKWLWCARFYKTRSLAAQAVTGGKAHLNGERVKPAHVVRVGDPSASCRTGWWLTTLCYLTPRGGGRQRKVSRTMLKRRPAPSGASVSGSNIGLPA